MMPVSKYISSLVCGQYQKSVEDIENTVIGNRVKRKRNLQQVMRESFFYGANRFGNNFIAQLEVQPENIKNLKWKRLLTNYDDTLAFIDSDRALKPYEVEVYELV